MSRHLPQLLAAAGFLAVSAAVLWSVAVSFAASQERSREYRYLSEALDPVEEPALSVTWQPSVRPLVREVTPGDAAMVGRALTQAWRAFAAAADTGETTLLVDHFAGTALGRTQLAASEAWRDGTRMVVLEQTARPEFVHLDGSVLQIAARAATVRYALRDGTLMHYDLSMDEVRTTLTNETTGWRIVNHERVGSLSVIAPPRPDLALPVLKGVNYFPALTPWRQFWPAFDAGLVADDLDLVAGLGGNSVRIFLPVADFGPGTGGQANLRNLQTFLDLAEGRKISVIPTLFDLRSGYRPALWADDVSYLRRVLPVLAAAPAVILVDLKNQPDLDRTAHGAGLVDAWLTTMALMVREISPDLPLTIGWSSADAAPGLIDLVDAVSYHDYAPVAGTSDRLAAVRAQSRGKPVLVTEIGASSFSLALGIPGSDQKQASELRDRLAQLSAADGVLVWTLHDFPKPDPVAVGASPWHQRLQARYGLFDENGQIKPAGLAVATAFGAPPLSP
ncbi:MAG: glycoside hydrolase family 5 protein [Tabrizicola sp.]|jgi:hypothetical protein|nr:glycoside hydrolase family 5 protein [Tabrizicola sp.]